MNPIPGRGYWGWGRGRGGGRGWRNWYHATGLTGWQRASMGWPTWGAAVPRAAVYPPPAPAAVGPQQELDALKGQAEYLEDALEGVRKRMQEIESQQKE
jgi:hypothetical protein